LRGNQLQPVYHGEHGLGALKELVRSYLTISKDLTRVMTRVKALYRSWGIPCSGTQVYSRLYRVAWLSRLTEPGVRLRAAFYFQQLDALRTLRQEVRRELLAESKKHKVWKRLCEIPRLARSARRWRLAFCRLRTVSAPSGSCGASVVLRSRRAAAPITALSTADSKR
jgi:hypothetical protein